METLINQKNALDVKIPGIPTLEELGKEILAVTQQGAEVAGHYVAQKAAEVTSMKNVILAAGRSTVRSMYAAGSVIRIMRDEVLVHDEYGNWVKDFCKIDPSTAWRWAEFAIRAHEQDLDSYESRRQALIATGVTKQQLRAAGVAKQSTRAALPSGSRLTRAVKAPLLRAAPATAQKSTKAASPSKRILKAAPMPKAVTVVALSLPAAVKQLDEAVTASVKHPVSEDSAAEREELREILGKLIAITRRLKEAITPKPGQWVCG